jgi:hypothetical protein
MESINSSADRTTTTAERTASSIKRGSDTANEIIARPSSYTGDYSHWREVIRPASRRTDYKNPVSMSAPGFLFTLRMTFFIIYFRVLQRKEIILGK